MADKPRKRRNWTHDNLRLAVQAVRDSKLSMHKASALYDIPRRTLRSYLNHHTTDELKKPGPPFLLTKIQNEDFCKCIKRLASTGYPITSKVLRTCIYKYCRDHNVRHRFSETNQTASYKWARKFIQANPSITLSKPLHMNASRGQKLKRSVVIEHFERYKSLLEENKLIDNPDAIYNMSDKLCHLTLPNNPKKLPQEGAPVEDTISCETSEGVIMVACVSASGKVIPPMILSKIKLEECTMNELPEGTVADITKDDCMTTDHFVSWLKHFGQHKPLGKCILVFDGSKGHLDYAIADEAEKHDIILYCLPFNTAHELQPMDKSVLKTFESYWNEELAKYWLSNPSQVLTIERLGGIFTPAWEKSFTEENIKLGFASSGLFPVNPKVIREEAFKPIEETPQVNNRDEKSSFPVLSKHNYPEPGPSATIEHNFEVGVHFLASGKSAIMEQT